MADDLNLGGLTKIVTVLAAALAYGTGVVAINTYLHALGIADFAFAKPKLLLAGIMILFSLMLLASHLFFLAWSLASRHGPAGNARLPSLRWLAAWALLFPATSGGRVRSPVLSEGLRPGADHSSPG